MAVRGEGIIADRLIMTAVVVGAGVVGAGVVIPLLVWLGERSA